MKNIERFERFERLDKLQRLEEKSEGISIVGYRVNPVGWPSATTSS